MNTSLSSRYIFLFLVLLIGSSSNQSNLDDCGFLGDLTDLEDVRCGLIEVPENHQNQSSRKIQIAFVVMNARDPASDSYPMIYFSGGPGSSAVTPAGLRGWYNSDLRQDRDLIFFDQRGIQHSSALPNMGPELFDIMARDLNNQRELELTLETLNRYRQIAKDQGVDLENYNSFQNARDVAVLMDYLGYVKYNLYGGSYGTRLARIVQDMFPDKINSVILNAPNPMGGDFLISRLQNYSLALQRIFDYCEQEDACRKNNPNLKSDYLHAIEDLKTRPLPVNFGEQQFIVNAQDAIYLLRRLLYSSNSREKAPALIQAFKNRDPAPIMEVLFMEGSLKARYNDTMWMSVERYEQFDPKNSPDVIDSIYSTLPLLPERLGHFTALYLAAQEWPFHYLPKDNRTFKTSGIPTIIFVNRYDPITPPINGVIMQEQLTRSRLFVLDEGGHGGGNLNCRIKVMNEFMTNPEGPLDTECLNLYQGGN